MLMNKDNKVLNVPHLRFPEFTKELKNTSLGKIGKTFNGLTGKSGSDFGQGFPYITYKSIFDNSKIDISRVEYVEITDIERKKETQNKVQYGDVFFTTSSETPDEVGMSSVLLDEIKDCYLNSFCFGYRLNSLSKTVPEYMRFYLRSQTIRKKMFVLAQGSTRFNISKSEVMGMSINIPEIEEQRKIANLLTLLDERLVTQNKIIDKLQSLIKGLVVTHYFTNLHTIKVRIGDLGEAYSTMAMSKEQLTETGNPCIFYGELFTIYGCVVGEVKSRTQFEKRSSTLSSGRDLLFPASTTVDALSLIAPSALMESGIILGGDMFGIKISEKYNPLYLSYYFNYIANKHLSKYAKGTTIIHLHYNEIANVAVELPSMQEQNRIITAIQGYSTKLALEETLLKRLSDLKQYLLGQMFI